MTPARTASVINNWETVRYELLNTRISDLGLKIEGSPVEPLIRRLNREFERKGLTFRPGFYLTDSWGCPDEVPFIGIPFYLADKRLARIEDEQTGEIEDEPTIMTFLRHEAGHAINYAYRLWELPGWTETFGRFSKAYRDSFEPNPLSRQFVRHLVHSQYRRNYAQKHPDEDFAETFAVWLMPRSGWRRKYRQWPALRKLEFTSRLMRRIRGRSPLCSGGRLVSPVDEMPMLLAEYYGQRAERYRAAAQYYVDDKLREAFPPIRGTGLSPAVGLLREHHAELLTRATVWSGMDEDDVKTILSKLEDRAAEMRVRFRPAEAPQKLLDLTALVTALAMDFGYTGRFTG